MSLAILIKQEIDPDGPVRNPLRVFEQGRKRVRALVGPVFEAEQIDFARAFCARIVDVWWLHLGSPGLFHPDVREPFGYFNVVDLPEPAAELADELGQAAAALEPDVAGFQVGTVYTAMLPSRFRSEYGVFYTPPHLANRLIDLATEAGTNWSTCRVLDPACGGGAFLAPVAKRMLGMTLGSPEQQLDHIAGFLHGQEIDPFAAWLSQVAVDVVALPLTRMTGERLPVVVSIRDSLHDFPTDRLYDLIIGNPPYGRIKLEPSERARFERSLFGHANLYGLFTDIALRHTRPGGVVAYVTPTSFLAGEYFKKLRSLLGRSACPVSLDFVASRKDVFDGVLQETLLAAYKRGTTNCSVTVSHLTMENGAGVSVEPIGQFSLPEEPGEPWIVPRSAPQAPFVSRLVRLPGRLADWGYAVSTGPLVWNRHKEQLSRKPGKNRYPLIWAEAISPNGSFKWRADRRNHTLYFEVNEKDQWLLTVGECVLLQRTTAKEQHRRLIAAPLPREFIDEFGAVVVENHINILKPIGDLPRVSTGMLAAFLNSAVVDTAFRCISGSVAVSAYELESIPLPLPEKISKIEGLVSANASDTSIEAAFSELFRG